jgi:hypothetical protein
MAQANIEASRRLIKEAFGKGRLELLDELCADGFVSHDPIQGDLTFMRDIGAMPEVAATGT